MQCSFFAAYFFVSMPSGWLVDRFGYRRGLVGGLLVAALGCLLFYPAAGFRSYPLFLLALFILAAGITLLQVAANPYVAMLGGAESASSRLNLTTGFNSLGTTLAPLCGSLLLLALAASPSRLEAVAETTRRQAEAAVVQVPYLGLGALLLVLATLLGWIRLPMAGPQAGPATTSESALGGLLRQLREQRGLALGAVGIFSYVGAEVAIGSFLVSYLGLTTVAGLSMAASARYVSLYWGGAMLGRFLGALVLRWLAPARLLAFNAVAAVALVVTAMLTGGQVAMWAILAVGLCNSIMFPTIFVLAIRGSEQRLGQASGILCMAIVGGAVVPVLLGLAADALGLRAAFMLPALCYAYIAFYGLRGHRLGERASDRQGEYLAAGAAHPGNLL